MCDGSRHNEDALILIQLADVLKYSLVLTHKQRKGSLMLHAGLHLNESFILISFLFAVLTVPLGLYLLKAI